jgi:oligopeptide/dipeptide ABC transporter ATP-binding protein
MAMVEGAPRQAGGSGRGEALLVVEDLEVEFSTDHGYVKVVEDVSFTVNAGERLALVGESGSGKTVTSLSLLQLLPPSGRVVGGSIRMEGRELVGLSERDLRQVRGEEIAMIFQEPMTSLNPAYTVGNQIAGAVRHHRGVSRKAAWARAVEVLDMVGIPNAASRAASYPHEFSGGMRQRAMIALAVSCEPKLLIADEPTTALDVTIQAQVLEVLRDMTDELGLAVLFITHDLGVVADLCDRVVVMYAGQVVEQAEIVELYEEPKHPYTSALLGAIAEVTGSDGRLKTIRGMTPPPWEMPEGCRFHPRCPHAVEACTAAPPALVQLAGSRASRCIRSEELDLRRPR